MGADVLVKSTGVRGTPKIVGNTRGLSIFLVRAFLWQREALFGGVLFR